MQSQTLNGNWLLHQCGTQDWFQATVPGGVHTDLLAAGRIPDPFFGVNEEAVQWVAEKDWEYRRYFYPTAQILAQPLIFLVCKGLDTLADVRLNGTILGLAANMFHTWQWEIKSLLKEGENRLDILFHSPVSFARQRQRINRMTGDENMSISGGQHLRKTPSHFGWDWGPRLPCIGIWKDILLEGRSEARLEDIRIEQTHENGMVMLTARVQCQLDLVVDPTGKEAQRTLRFRVTAPDRQIWQADAPAREQQSIPIKITNPQLWWPNGLGEQVLYRVEIELLAEDRVLQETQIIDTHTEALGLRTIELHQEPGAEPAPGRKSFQFVVNGIPVFCKGANWIPVDSFPTRIRAEQVEHLVRSAAETNQNMLRVWGGGYYESDWFYDLCDQYGILVWQDFQFACASYPLDDAAYLESIRREVVENVRRLRHHACLALWCGNNEIELLSKIWGWPKKRPELKAAYERFFYHQLPEIIATEDPQRAYWPSSPSSDEAFSEPNSDLRGDAHLWEVYHYYKQPAFYRQQNPRFVSEFGMQSLPAEETIAGFAEADAQKLGSKVMLNHQRAMAGNPKLTWYIAQRFRLPRSFAGMVYLSQIFQAETIRCGVEHWRRHPENTSGALYWQLNDCWPVISWASIDYYGRWKALHYAARRFFAPLLLSVVEEGNKGQHKAAVWVTNDRREPFQGRLHWTLETLDGEVIEGGEQAVQAAPISASCLLHLDFSQPKKHVDWHKTTLVVELLSGEERVTLDTIAFVAEKNMDLGVPGLETRVEIANGRLLFHLSTRRLACFIELKLEGANPIFSDNYFHLPARRQATIECALPDGWDIQQ
ncbi:MAG: glycoside hydrolase family 2 protein, partial [Anaerolineaceae bacterium]|nr:glycoside hydrolase family 2 protein [Anaerolineaceae bacterium]